MTDMRSKSFQTRNVRAQLTLLVAMLLAGVAFADSVQHEPKNPTSVIMRDDAGELIKGRMLHFDQDAFTMEIDETGERSTVPWSRHDAVWAYRLMQRMLDQENAADWVLASQILEPLERGERYSELALKRALAIDPEAAKKAQANTRQTSSPDGGAEQRGGEHGHDHGPRVIGDSGGILEWPELTEQQHEAAIEAIHRDTQAALERAKIETDHSETKYFILYTNIDGKEARQWLTLLDKMYYRLCRVFDIKRGTNIWRGKALIVILRDRQEYHRYNQMAFGNPVQGSAGVCWSFGNGNVKISFYRQPDIGTFAHILVHEAVHGFLHRYIGPGRVPSWANEGLAEFLADELVPGTGIMKWKREFSLSVMKRNQHVGGFFMLSHIEGWQYGVAYDLAATMIRDNRRGYVKFIKAIKAGKHWQKALAEDYGLPVDKLVSAYGRVLGIPALKAHLPESR